MKEPQRRLEDPSRCGWEVESKKMVQRARQAKEATKWRSFRKVVAEMKTEVRRTRQGLQETAGNGTCCFRALAEVRGSPSWEAQEKLQNTMDVGDGWQKWNATKARMAIKIYHTEKKKIIAANKAGTNIGIKSVTFHDRHYNVWHGPHTSGWEEIEANNW